MNSKTIASILVVIGIVAILGAVMWKVSSDKKVSTSPMPPVEVPKGKLPAGSLVPGTAAQVQAQTWVWQKTIKSDGTVITPNKPGIFTLTFGKDGRVTGKTDCNGFGGDYQIGSDGVMSFGAFMSTQMYCEGSQESVYSQAVSQISSYRMQDGGLVLQGTQATSYFK
jgi:heat shock protein HslJ